MALSHDHPAYKKKLAQAKKAKADILSKIFDVEQYTEPANWQNGCHQCHYWSECISVLKVTYVDESGLHYIPLRCFAEHPEYKRNEWLFRSK